MPAASIAKHRSPSLASGSKGLTKSFFGLCRCTDWRRCEPSIPVAPRSWFRTTRAVRISLDKLVIDTVDDAEAWKPMSTHVSHFGTMAVTLPSDAVGGAVTISHENRSTTWDTVADCLLGFFDTCSVHVAPITSGARATLFFCAKTEECDSDDDDETPLRLTTRADMLKVVAATHTYE